MKRSGTSATEAFDRLYEAPLDAFVALRRDLAAALKAAGDAPGAAQVAAARKPSRTAWALNQVARRRPEELRAALDAHVAAAGAQGHSDAESMRETVRAFREALSELTRSCAAIAAGAGVALSAGQLRQLGETVRAALAGGASRERLLAGRLSEDAELEDPFAGLGGGSRPRGPRREAAPSQDERAAEKARLREAERAREAREQARKEARRRVEGLEQEARDARDAARQAELRARNAQAEADRLRRTATALEERLAQARSEYERS